MSKCACGSGIDFTDCCAPYLEGKKQVLTAEALMRSRYTAYVVENIDYIDESHHPDFGKDFDKAEALKWAQDSDWQGLEIIQTEKGQKDDKEGMVEFVAKYKLEGKLAQHREIAQFQKHKDKWFYTEGTIVGAQPIERIGPKVGRNDPCHCGSGKKYKKCCL